MNKIYFWVVMFGGILIIPFVNAVCSFYLPEFWADGINDLLHLWWGMLFYKYGFSE